MNLHKETYVRAAACTLVLLFLAAAVLAQTVEVNIKFDINKGKHNDSKVTIARDGKEVKAISPAKARLIEVLEYGSDYILTFEKPGYITKRIAINTRNVPKESQEDDLGFDFAVEIFQQYDGLNTVVFNQPVARYYYDPKEDAFTYDTDYTKSIRAALTAFEQEYTEQEKNQIPKETSATAKAEEEARRQAEARAAEEQRKVEEARAKAAEEKRLEAQKAEERQQQKLAEEARAKAAAEEAKRKAEAERQENQASAAREREEQERRAAEARMAEEKQRELSARMAEEQGLFYFYDVWKGLRADDWAAVRLRNAELIRRARHYLVWEPDAWHQPWRDGTGRDVALSTRYFEGAAGGAVLLGSAPKHCPEFDEAFDWPDAVVELGDDPAGVLAALAADPMRVLRIRTQNVVASLRRHDWAHRWAEVLDVLGEPLTLAHRARLARLDLMAAQIDVQPVRRPGLHSVQGGVA